MAMLVFAHLASNLMTVAEMLMDAVFGSSYPAKMMDIEVVAVHERIAPAPAHAHVHAMDAAAQCLLHPTTRVKDMEVGSSMICSNMTCLETIRSFLFQAR
jgi:hypothetical protein